MAENNNLMSFDAPYVHSNFYNFARIVKTDFDANYAKDSTKKLKEVISRMEKEIKVLRDSERQIYNACGVSGWQELNQKLFGSQNEKDFRSAAVATLRSKEFYQAVTPKIASDLLTKALDKTDLLPFLGRDFIEDFEDITYQAVIEKIVGKIYRSLSHMKVPRGISKVNIQMSKMSSLGISVDWGRAISSKKGVLEKAIKAYLKPKLENIAFNSNNEAFIKQAFIKVFNSKNQTWIFEEDSQTLDDYAAEVAKILNKQLTLFYSNNIGTIGEISPQIQVKDSGLEGNLSFEIVGDLSEKEIEKRYNQYGITAMHSYHNDSKMSMTDDLIVIDTPNGKKVGFRAQSKNKAISELVAKGEFPFLVKMQDDINIRDLMERLNGQSNLSGIDFGYIGYLLANAVWFETHQSISSQSKEGARNRTGDTNTVGGYYDRVTRILETSIESFIGMEIGLNLDKQADIFIGQSNIFYILGAATLYPVSEVLKNAIDQIRGLTTQIFKMKIVVNKNSASFSSNTAQEFRTEKLNAVGHFSQATYTDENLLAVGRAQGGSIMSSLTGHINFNFDLNKILLRSAYNI